MRLLFSEVRSDYGRYQFPYVIWAVPEPGETPGMLMRRGFLPSSPALDRFYLCRNLRIELGRYRATTENRRILRKGVGIGMEMVRRDAFEYDAARRAKWKAYADRRFGEGVMTWERLDRLMRSRQVTHLLSFREETTGREVGTVLIYLEEPVLAYYGYAFYDLDHAERSLGLLLMTRAVEFFAGGRVQHLHLGTCYSERALYKAQFRGLEFFNGSRWSSNVEELKHLIRREVDGATLHLLETRDFLDQFYGGEWEQFLRGGGFSVGLDSADPVFGPDRG
jgi:arginyl-tRNA--protein-N-Asp/Glu arginylyltransferase